VFVHHVWDVCVRRFVPWCYALLRLLPLLTRSVTAQVTTDVVQIFIATKQQKNNNQANLMWIKMMCTDGTLNQLRIAPFDHLQVLRRLIPTKFTK
jgi:hypothetical protein